MVNMYSIILSLLATVGAYIIIGIFYLGTHRWPSTYQNKTVLIVIAHPDDEAMFFGPTIRYFKNKVFLLCLTNGGHDGLGEARAEELVFSTTRLGLPPHCVKLVNNRLIRDNPQTEWDAQVVAKEVAEYANKVKADIIISFDKYGVSGHINHISTSLGVSYAVKNRLVHESTLLYQLESVNMLRKYSSFIDCFISTLSCVYSISSLKDVVHIQSAMKCHKTQLTWFRRLYVMFSRYMVVNTLKSIIN